MPQKESKRQKELSSLYDKQQLYSPSQAAEIAKKTALAKFNETIEIALRLNMKKGQNVRGTLLLPHQTSKKKKILVLARGKKAEEAEQAEADYVGDIDLIEKIRSGWLDFDVVIATPDMMREVGKLGQVLGRRGLMPNPKSKTVTTDIKQTVQELRKGRVEIRADKSGIVHLAIGKATMEAALIAENIAAVIHTIRAMKPAETKGEFIISVSISATMGPGIWIDMAKGEHHDR